MEQVIELLLAHNLTINNLRKQIMMINDLWDHGEVVVTIMMRLVTSLPSIEVGNR